MNNSEKHICVKSQHSELDRIRKFVQLEAKNFGFNDKISYQISLAVDEACTNLINYAYDKKNDKDICIKLDKNTEEIIIKIYDEGEPFDPSRAESPNMKEYRKKMKRGGLGIHIIKLVMDKINYYPSENNKNILELRKKIA